MINEAATAKGAEGRDLGQALHYALECPGCGSSIEDDGVALHPHCCGYKGLLRAAYRARTLRVGDKGRGLFRFSDWLPVRRSFPNSAAPVTFRSEGLAARLGLENLWITFTGHWPERGAKTATGTFKENEAYAVCARLPDKLEEVLVVASAGNTARAFAHVCSQHRIPNLLVVPEFALPQLWFREELAPCVRLLSVRGDYTDAIQLAGEICKAQGFRPEGGARNVARRDGMGTTFLSAATTIGELPDHYFQAVGSGTGAIAAWEAGQRLRAGGWGTKKTRLHIAQNAPFTPLVQSWNARSRTLFLGAESQVRGQIGQIAAKVLANRTPAYAVDGGLFEAMQDSGGEAYAVNNEEAREAALLFEETEGIDPSPAAAVAIAAVAQAAARRTVGRHDIVNLNVTGGGFRDLREAAAHSLTPSLTVKGNGQSQPPEALLDEMRGWFG